MLPHTFGQVIPPLDSRHQPPKTILPSSSPKRLAASGSCSLRKRSARAKNCCCFRFSASIPFSISSNNMRFLLSFRLLAILPTCFATLGGRLTLWRTDFSAIFMAPLCTRMVYERFERLKQRRSRGRPPAIRLTYNVQPGILTFVILTSRARETGRLWKRERVKQFENIAGGALRRLTALD